ncbi:MAG: sulfatase-like hydrolase/transferase [Planctomycetes bacterium]|jgi:membrane-anchored protein YejM (alkaline phosphatase superfamily)|nr:sulfatase-like hydrolase/transferase [Planctomycetota bacterium]
MPAPGSPLPLSVEPSRSTARAARLRAVLFVALANLALACAIGTAYLDSLPEHPGPRLWWFAHAGLVSSMLTLVFVPGACLALAALSRLGDRTLLVGQTLLWSFFHLTLFIDTRVFGLYQYHLNGAAWNLLTTRGSQDSYHLGPRIWALGTGMFLVLALAQWAFWKLAWKRIERTQGRSTLRSAAAWVALLAAAIGVEKTIYFDADLTRDRAVGQLSNLFPVYPRFSAQALLPGEVSAAERGESSFAIRTEGGVLDLPQEGLRLPEGGPRPNILILVVDSWRADMLDPEVTPRLWAFAQGARRFENHLSGGNATRFGVFSLLYGLHGSYWWPVLEAERPPILLEVLRKSGYQARVFSSASMEFPEFRRTAWATLGPEVEDRFPSPRRAERDALLGARFAEWVPEALAAGQPFFAFALLDSAHQTYDFPSDQALFQPCAEELDYLEMARTHDGLLRDQVKNRYKNALHYVDTIAGSMLEALRREGALENTLVLVTGDHGEEFAEHGHWGHTSNFTPEQVLVPLVLCGPGIEPGVELRPTAHLDVAPTLLELLGLPASARPGWSLGENLLAPLARRDRVVAGWGEIGLWTGDGIFRIPMDADRPLELAVFDSSWSLLADQDQRFARNSEALSRLASECVRFLQFPAGRGARKPQ